MLSFNTSFTSLAKTQQTEESINIRIALVINFKYWNFIIREDGALVPKYMVDALLWIFIIKSVNVFVKADCVH